ncbi:MAG: hypothetical protein OEW23_05385 [Candidatus Aminicenantes bacterium]|nr:hypothetical protein [Candidatus Aminicenantes bacterium]
MAKKDDTPEKPSTILDEIEQQLEHALAKKKEDVEKELEERIRKEKEEAQKKIQDIDKEIAKEKKTLIDFKTLLAEFETNKRDLKKQIKEHIEKAIRFQTEIESLTGQTLEELKKVSELNQKLEELQHDTGEKVSALKKDLEEKFGIVAEVPGGEEAEETEINLDRELAKLKKIKELLDNSGAVEELVTEEMPEEPIEQEVVEEPVEEKPEEEAVPEEEEKKEEPEIEVLEPGGPPPAEGPEEVTEEPEEPEAAPEQDEISFQVAFDKLEQYRKGSTNENDAEISYFENNEKIVLDGEYIISTLNNHFEEAKKLYIKLSQTESPKDQFFIKQEIIKHQEALRKVMLRSIRLCEQENCSLPEYTVEILSLDVLKNVLEKVSMQNWSNQDDFSSFDNFSKELKDSFYSKITPPAAYLQSIMKELDIS